MRILYLSFYFPPDLCAGSFRNGPLVDALKSKLQAEDTIEVLTTFPNRYSGYSAETEEVEVNHNFIIKRVKLPFHRSGMLDQAKAFLSYCNFVRREVKDKEYDLVFSSSSRLMTAALGSLIAHKRKIPLYLDIRDIFVDTIKDVLPRKISWLMTPIFSVVEKWSFSKASRINIVSKGFLPYFTERYPAIPISFFTNGIDEAFLSYPLGGSGLNEVNVLPCVSDNRLEILYAGNVGEGQGLENIIPELAVNLRSKVKIRIIGAGGRLVRLKGKLDELGCDNVIISPPVSRCRLIDYYLNANVLFLHLNNYDAFLKVLPSKIFEYAAMGKPILAGVDGYAKVFLENNIDNAYVFSPCDVNSAQAALEKIEIKTEVRESFISQYRRSEIMNKMSDDILKVVRP